MRLGRVAVDSGELDSALAKSLTMSTFFLQWYAEHIYLISCSHFALVYLVPSWYIRKSFSSSLVHIALKACLYNTNSVEKVIFHGLVRCFSVKKKKEKWVIFPQVHRKPFPILFVWVGVHVWVCMENSIVIQTCPSWWTT